jgi:leucyl-tRNA synthetase
VPETVADVYGVDVVRMYLMFMGPFDSTMAWNEKTLMGVKRFLDRFERLVRCSTKVSSGQGINPASGREVKVIINKLIDGVTEDLEVFKYNTAIAKMMEALNKINNEKLIINNEDIKALVKLLAPFAPYLAEELYFMVGVRNASPLQQEYVSVHASEWPVAEEKYLVEDEVIVMIAINGKVRDQMSVDRSQISDEKEIIKKAKELKNIKKWVGDKKIVKEIYVEGKMINFAILD